MADVVVKGPVVEMIQHQQTVHRLLNSEDAREGIAAQKEQRKPRFTGR